MLCVQEVLNPFYIVRHYIEWAKTFWTYSILQIFPIHARIICVIHFSINTTSIAGVMPFSGDIYDIRSRDVQDYPTGGGGQLPHNPP